MRPDRRGERGMGWKDRRDACPIPHFFLQGQSPVCKTSIPIILEAKKGEKTPVMKGAVVSRPCGPFLAKSGRRQKNSYASCAPAEPQAPS